MPSCRFCSWFTKSLLLAAVCCAGAVSVVALAAEDQPGPPEAPPVSEFAPVEPLMFSVNEFMEDLATTFGRGSYTEAVQTRVARDANVLAVLFMALGQHDQEAPLKESASRLADLAEELAAAVTDQAKAKSTYEALVTGVKEGAPGGEPLAWEKRFQLGLLMKQVSPTNTRLKLYTSNDARFARADKEQLAGYAAFLAAVGQAIQADTHEVKDPAMIGDWYKYAAEMRDAAGTVGKAIQAGNFADIQASIQALNANCDACHEAFRIEGL